VPLNQRRRWAEARETLALALAVRRDSLPKVSWPISSRSSVAEVARGRRQPEKAHQYCDEAKRLQAKILKDGA
jgi:hypothetical protein